MTDRLQKLLGVADQSAQLEIKMANNGLISAMRAYNERASKQTKEDYEAARELFDSVCAKFTAQYFPEEIPAPEGERFKNRLAALKWLNNQGYKIGQQTFYNHCADGFPVLHKDKTVSRFQVMQYAQQLDVERRGAVSPAGETDDDARKLKAQADQEEMKAEKMRREQDAEWLHADAAWSAVAALVGTIQDSLRHHLHTSQGQIIHAAGGDIARGPEVYECLEDVVSRAFNEVAGVGRIEGVFCRDDGE